ncbi:MAG: GH3 auxin-responsive promoter family protein [Bacteroidales bacterium]|nr:GH3 auxin-responsive promoter family protein [Bacteroidales bacterium]
MNLNYRLINNLVWAGGFGEMQKLRAACSFPESAQEKTLRNILASASETVYGKEHHFSEIISAKTDADMIQLFRRNVPPVEYEDLRPYVKRMMSGEADVLFAGKPVFYATTSGSTGDPKYIPFSQTYKENVYGRMSRLMLFIFRKFRKQVFSGYLFSVVGKAVEGRTPDGTVYGSVSSLMQRSAPKFMRDIYAVPNEVYEIEDYGARNYTLMRFAIEKNVTLWVAPNPSTVLELQNNVDQWLDDFIEDIGNGTLSDRIPVPEGIRAALKKYLKPNPERAFELRRLQTMNERVLPRHYWPELQIVSTWKCGNTQIYLKRMSQFFRYTVFHQELGYFASECRAGLTLDGSNESVPMPHMHFYEFKREKDLKDPEAPFLLLNELKEGERYCPFITTDSGLYRYNMNDIVQVSSPYLNTPRLHMVQKVNGIVSITGEKLYEDQFIKAVDMAQAATGKTLVYYSGYVNLSESRYDWYFEFKDRKIKQKDAEAFAKIVDDNLKNLNIEYESKRNSFRLKNPAVFLLEPNTFDKFKAYILGKTHRDASRFKPNVLAQNEEIHNVINRFILRRKKR